MEEFKTILNYTFQISDKISVSVKAILVLLVVFLLTSFVLKILRKIVSRRLSSEDKDKFKTVFSFLKYIIYTIVIITTLESSGVEVSMILAGSAALLVGLGLGLQTLFQDIISGIFILLDKTLHVNDIIEIDGKVGRVFEIKLRTTRAVTIDDRVLIIPNHQFLTQSLFNWTQNGKETVESIDIGVAYGSDVEQVKKVLIETAKECPEVLKNRKITVLFLDFGESSLSFRLLFTINDSFKQVKIKSDLRFLIEKKFRENNITIPFPQRDVHLYQHK